MRKLITVAILGLAAAASSVSAQPAENGATDIADGPVQVMILGTYHFGNPGRDVVNIETDDVTVPRRQRELEILAGALAQWAPDRILVEREAAGPDFIDSDYEHYSQPMLDNDRNEIVQIGYRLAALLGHDHVFGFDERGGEGEPDYFPFGSVTSYAEEHGQSDIIDRLFDEVRARAEAESAAQSGRSIAESLIEQNDRAEVDEAHRRAYYGMLAIGDGNAQPGAELNAYWYMRNAKMFAKLGLIAEPGERIFVIVGSGHSYWLRHFVEDTPGYELVDPLPYLRAAAIVSRDRRSTD